MQKLLNVLWEFTGGKEDKDNFIQKTLNVCKVFKVKPLKTPRLDVPSKKTAYNLFCKDTRKIKKELQCVPVSMASAIILKERKKVKASNKKMKKYEDLYEEEKRRHEEALQRYQEDHMDEMKIINLHKRCSKAGKAPQPKKAPKSPKSDEPKKVLGSPGLTDDPGEEEQSPKKASRSSDGKKTAARTRKKVKKTPQPKKGPKSTKFINSSKEEEGPPRDDKEKKTPPLLGLKEEAQGLIELRKESKKLTFEKKVEKVVFMREPYEGHELSYVALYDTKYLRRC